MKIMKQVKKTFTTGEGRVSGAVGAGTVLVIGVGVGIWANNDFNKRLAEAEAKAKEGYDTGYKEGHDAGYKEGTEANNTSMQACVRENQILNQMILNHCSRQEAEALVAAMNPPTTNA